MQGYAYRDADPIRQLRPHLATPDDDLSPIPHSRLLRDPPARDWMVDKLFLRSTVALIAGDGGRGKSLLCQQLATCAVMGRPWLGMSLKPGKALYLACEDDTDELHRRQADINRHLGVGMEDVLEQGLSLYPRVGHDNAIMAFERSGWRVKPTGLRERLVKRLATDGIQYLIVDTATKTFRGNQNDENQVDDYITELRRMAVMMQGVVIITKHPSVTGRALGTGESGSVSWNNSVRARVYLHSDKAGNTVLEGMKSNYGPNAPQIPVKWQAGVFVRNEPAAAYNPYRDD